METYKHILIAVDFSQHNAEVCAKAKGLAEQYQARLSIVHVLDNVAMPDAAYGTVIPIDRDSGDDRLDAEKNNLLQIADRLNVDRQNIWLIWGKPKQEIITFAEQQRVDLIVLGSHGRHGLSLLLGSTANAVLHHAQCDVMAVRLQNE